MRICDWCGDKGPPKVAPVRLITIDGPMVEWGPFDLHESCLHQWVGAMVEHQLSITERDDV